jgi:hypothetical protein
VDGQRFDGLARRFATATNRRGFLRGVVIGGAGSVLAGRGHLAPDTAAQQADCASFCQQLPPGPERGRCVADAANGTGLCFQCGPSSTDPAQQLCGGGCVDTSTHTQHCGFCGEVCASGQICELGWCTTPCSDGLTPCGGACVDTDTDTQHCGRCDNPCVFANASATCVLGTCTLGTCAAGFGDCNGNPSDGCETNLAGDLGNCGSCGIVCPAPSNATATCAGRQCGFDCLAGFGDCDGVASTGCEQDLLTDPENCGSCGFACPADPNELAICTNGGCGIECALGFSPCGEDRRCCPNGFCLDGACVGGICSPGAVGCNPGPSLCYCFATYAGPRVCTPASGAICNEPSCDPDDPNACPTGSFCSPAQCGNPPTVSGRCAPVGPCPANFGCGTDNCHTGQTCQSDGICRPE